MRKSTLEEANELIEKIKEETKDKMLRELKANTPVDTGKARDSWIKTETGLKNNVEYIDKLNSGSSKQAPKYFIEGTLLSIKGVKPNGTIVRKTGPT